MRHEANMSAVSCSLKLKAPLSDSVLVTSEL